MNPGGEIQYSESHKRGVRSVVVEFGVFVRAACLQNETAPEKLLNRYEKRSEKRKKRSEKRSEARPKKN